ncbi:MAG: cytochrome c oxidase assembly protein subunit 15 [Candidatus Omnitrophota bacterium]|jgi:cytochrome c oxidase assembly protein subunit 15
MNTQELVYLRRFAKLTCFATLFLIFAGAMVNSTGSGLAVPDWPTSYGNWYFVPMVGGVFYEHGHRLIAQAVGLLTVVLAIWLKRKDPRKWMHVLGFCAVGAVIIQGILGGITVLFYLPTAISTLHGVLAQSFFILTIIIVYSLSKERTGRLNLTADAECLPLIKPALLFTAIVFVQLIMGAIMRHSGSGLAIYDFPKMAGQWIPTFDRDMLFVLNDWRFENNLDPVNMTQVVLHFIHRVGAVIVLIGLGLIHSKFLKYAKNNKLIKQSIIILTGLIVVQVSLGIATVLTVKTPVIASLHVLVGAITLGFSVLLVLRAMPTSLAKLKL